MKGGKTPFKRQNKEETGVIIIQEIFSLFSSLNSEYSESFLLQKL
jgi:hypothetical protein